MSKRLPIRIHPQPDDLSCGPTCLHAVYAFYGDDIALERVLAEVKRLDDGGTLAVFLACHALARGYRAKIFTHNLQMFDPTWFGGNSVDLADRLRRQEAFRQDPKVTAATEGYLEVLDRGGEISFRPFSADLLKRYLNRSVPILAGLSATYLYETAREYGPTGDYDDIRGEPVGHFVVLAGYDRRHRQILVADPLYPNPLSDKHNYTVGMTRLVHSILLGIVTYDANLLIVTPPSEPAGAGRPS
jgi:hypothetical protein